MLQLRSQYTLSVEMLLGRFGQSNKFRNLLINNMYARSAPEMLSLKEEYILCFLNFIIMSVCNSLANC